MRYFKWKYDEQKKRLEIEGKFFIEYLITSTENVYYISFNGRKPRIKKNMHGIYFNGLKLSDKAPPTVVDWNGIKFYAVEMKLGTEIVYYPLEYGRLISTVDFKKFHLDGEVLPSSLCKPEYIKTLARGEVKVNGKTLYILVAAGGKVKIATTSDKKFCGAIITINQLKELLDGNLSDVQFKEIVEFMEEPKTVSLGSIQPVHPLPL